MTQPFRIWHSLYLVFFSLSFAQSPSVLHEDISLNKVLDITSGFIRIVLNPANEEFYVLKTEEGIFHLDLTTEPSLVKVTSVLEIGGQATGLAFDSKGTAYAVLNQTIDEVFTMAYIRKGMPDGEGSFRWETIAVTEQYPRSNTVFNHNYNGIVVSPDDKWLYINAGSRTDHGEIQDFEGQFPDLREVPLTTKIMRIPTDAQNITLVNDEEALIEGNYIYAWGMRNAYDLAFAPNGHLFGVENGPDADYPEELNWIREGHHYGFPWKFGAWDNQQQFADYDSENDKLQQPDFIAVQSGFYQNDPTFPPPPTDFTLPVANLGPDAMIYRTFDGDEVNAAENNETLYTFTPHRSPLGLVFVDNDAMPEKWQSTGSTQSAFLLSWGAAGGTLSDKGMDVLHLTLKQSNENYESITTKIAANFRNPIDAALLDNDLYIIEWGNPAAIWKLSFKR